MSNEPKVRLSGSVEPLQYADKKSGNLKAIPNEILKIQNGKCLFGGKTINVSQEVRAGFTWGEIRIARLRDDEVEDASSASVANKEGDDLLIIPFQNENLVAYVEKRDGSRRRRRRRNLLHNRTCLKISTPGPGSIPMAAKYNDDTSSLFPGPLIPCTDELPSPDSGVDLPEMSGRNGHRKSVIYLSLYFLQIQKNTLSNYEAD
ncbi:hypothetical protein K435DRAFT_860565 [Dendrothele bispora CBS 962.96]|uniref:S-Me-THD-like C-terminal domain-containing protein n=1 Tax=Dendrothele bispora (strain CBS 962.96) TaxID=1314807 RepID=A0A4S8LXP9_DENBC|nr:hypothetical protein K435DRAFT_860565 [Dendrothele bispora CBS 962.96]